MNTDELDSLTDSQLSEAFAVEVVGYLQQKVHGWGPCLMFCHPNGAVVENCDDSGNCTPWQPDFATSADAVLPFLENPLSCEASWVIAGVSIRLCYRGQQTPENPLAHCHAYATAKTFARAACIALIRAKRSSK